MTADTDRRRLIGGAIAAAAITTAPLARAQDVAPLEERGYALGDMVKGDPNAPVAVTEYASMTCPGCRAYHESFLPAFEEQYIETGKVVFTFREVYFDQYGLWASMLARCGGEQTFFPIVDALYVQQRQWADPQRAVEELQRIGRLAGLPAERMQACLTDEDLLRNLVESYQTNAVADGVTSTPSFLVNGRLIDAGQRPTIAEIAEKLIEAVESHL